ncbi:MAG: GerMN domain-containing protein [Candidatus Portnoybacteria bacterium]|nr:GerMN domain-containing protein [Candidatus Portnoybacteria bacterium]
MNKKLFIIIGAILLAIILIVAGLKFFTDEDTWICQDGQWVKHGNPSAQKPTEPCNGAPNIEPDVILTSPQPNQVIQNPLIVEGKAKGAWFFEASFPIRILDAQGNEIEASFVQATEDWMQAGYVTFKGEIRFPPSLTGEGTLLLQKDNPSGLPENDKEFRVPIKFPAQETIKVKVFFGNSNLDPENSCNKVFSIEREIAKTQATAKAALEELLAGPTAKEKSEGYFTSINSGVKIQSLTIENEIAKVDFDEQLEFQVGGSCRVSAIRAQITETLKQFSSAKNVIISIDGRAEDILQP